MTKEQAKIKAAKRHEWAFIAEKKAVEIQSTLKTLPFYTDFAFWSEPIKIGHHSESRHRKTREYFNNKERQVFELNEKAKIHRNKATNLLDFANRNKGDAEIRRQKKRDVITAEIALGNEVNTTFYGMGKITKINKKTVRVLTDRGFETTIDKSFIRI